MRPLLALLAAVLLATTAAACGGDSQPSTPAGTSTTASHQKRDRDGDEDNNDDDHVLGFGHLAVGAEGRATATLLEDYFAAAGAENGAKACSLLAPFIAETVVEENGHSPALEGASCAVVMTKLFTLNHQELAGKSANLKVLRVGVEGDKALAVLEFSEIPEIRQITLRREGSTWTVIDLLDGKIE